MTPINKCIRENSTELNPIWLMRQAGRYLPEFREIRSKNKDFIKLCLNENLSSEITLQPIKRFNFDAAIIFSDILMVPYGFGQSVKFEKNFGPKLGSISLDAILNFDEEKFTNKLKPVYNLISKLRDEQITNGKDVIGFVGAPWTILVYVVNKISPKKNLREDFFNDKVLINRLLLVITKFIKIHIKNQVQAGASIIQVFDSWAGLLKEDIEKFIFKPTHEIVEFTKGLNTPIICFPRGIKNYTEFCKIVKPDMVNIDYDVDPIQIVKDLRIPIQGGLDPKVLLTDKHNLRKNVLKYLNIFNDHPYVFNLGHGILPQTEISMVEELVKIVRDFK